MPCLGLACEISTCRIASDFVSSSTPFSFRRLKSVVLTENGGVGDSHPFFLIDNAVAVPAAIVQATAQCPFLTIKKSFRLSLNKRDRLPMHLGKELKGLVMFTFLGA